MNSSSKPKQLIDNKSAKILCDNFIRVKADVLKRIYDREDANAFWFSVEVLEDYLAYVKKQGQSLNIDVNGIRIYLGSYSENTRIKDEGLTTVFLTPTKKAADSPEGTAAVGSGDGPASIDATEIESLNYGGIGNPPQIIFEI